MTVLLGSTSIGTAVLSGAGRRLLALTSTFSVTITVPAGTAAGNQVPCMLGLSHAMLRSVPSRLCPGRFSAKAPSDAERYPAGVLHRMCMQWTGCLIACEEVEVPSEMVQLLRHVAPCRC